MDRCRTCLWVRLYAYANDWRCFAASVYDQRIGEYVVPKAGRACEDLVLDGRCPHYKAKYHKKKA